ncbi:MAG: InlB B-repeat-containing protein [Clostridia bacterium]|nr:InlB B-repeat-containing protein [Clostridia bacterium]
MKKVLAALAMVLVLVLAMGTFAACGQTNPPADEDTVTVTWYQGSKPLKEEEVAKGSKVSSWTPEVEGKTFTGWYSEASCTQAFDFETVINEDTDIFAAFKSDEYVEDDKAYYLCGAGSGDMGKSNWNNADETSLAMTKEDVEGANVYTIEITMYAGDRFQILYGGTWDGQVGIGFMVGAEYCDGVNEYDKNSYTAADKKVAQVKNAEGEVVFVGSDEYNKGFEVWNIILAEGQDGVYKITYTTYPASPAYNQITWELVEKVEPLTKTHDMYLVGTFNEWKTTVEEGLIALAESEDKKSWTGTITITEAMLADWTTTDPDNTTGVKCAALKVFNLVNGDWIGYEGKNLFLPLGTYSIKYDVESNSFEYAECAYYVVGTFVDGEGNAVNFSIKEGVTPSLVVADGVATGTFTAVDVTENSSYTWIASQGKPGVFAVKVVYGSELGIATWYSDAANNGDNWYVAAGTYSISLNVADGSVTITPAN